MNNQQDKAFNYIYSTSDGYKRVLPLLPPINNSKIPEITDYNRFYKDIRTNTIVTESTWEDWDNIKKELFDEIEKLVALCKTEIAAFGKSWEFKDIKNLVFAAYEKIWDEMNIKSYPSTFNINIQMFDAYLLSPNCFNTINNIIDHSSYSKDLQRYNNIVKDAKTAYIRKITLPEWNTQDVTSRKTQKDRWYNRMYVIEQL